MRRPATAALARRIGGELLTKLIEEDEMREDDEVARVEAFCLKKDWKLAKLEIAAYAQLENHYSNNALTK
jgi:hypothetical protein